MWERCADVGDDLWVQRMGTVLGCSWRRTGIMTGSKGWHRTCQGAMSTVIAEVLCIRVGTLGGTECAWHLVPDQPSLNSHLAAVGFGFESLWFRV